MNWPYKQRIKILQFGYNQQNFLISTLLQILNEKSQAPSDGNSFLERLLDVSNKYPNFTFEDVLAETATILTGVITITTNFVCLVSN